MFLCSPDPHSLILANLVGEFQILSVCVRGQFVPDVIGVHLRFHLIPE